MLFFCPFNCTLSDSWFHICLIGITTSFREMPRGCGSAASWLHCDIAHWHFVSVTRAVTAAGNEKYFWQTKGEKWQVSLSFTGFCRTERSLRPRVVERRADHTWRGVLGLCFCFEVQIRERLSYQSSDTDCTRRCRPTMRYDRCFLDKCSLAEKALRRAEQEERRLRQMSTNGKNKPLLLLSVSLSRL